jgi:hypothetical protein
VGAPARTDETALDAALAPLDTALDAALAALDAPLVTWLATDEPMLAALDATLSPASLAWEQLTAKAAAMARPPTAAPVRAISLEFTVSSCSLDDGVKAT